ncbi:MAG TPA: class I SAM-dependent methyltransferase [Solirubrobacteraceae bacterium]|nr:class I SAM-dependent methyltransferase [Solirubrobacteraceae bacterium]
MHRSIAKSLEPRSVLDAGCADARLTAQLAQRFPEATVVGIDADPLIVASAQAVARREENVTVKTGKIAGPPLDWSFDLVVCVDVLEHLPDTHAALAWLTAHTRPGGSLILHVPAAPQRHRARSLRDAMKAELQAGAGPHLREGYAPHELQAAAAAAGLVEVRTDFTFHLGATRWAADVESRIALRSAKPLKAILLPALLAASAVERSPSSHRLGNGVLMTARRP